MLIVYIIVYFQNKLSNQYFSKEEDLAKYIAETKGTHWGWCLRIMGCDLINLANVVFQIWFTDMFLGYEFSLYGVSAARYRYKNFLVKC